MQMIASDFGSFGFELSLCEGHYDGTCTDTRTIETKSSSISIDREPSAPSMPDMVTVRMKDLVSALRTSLQSRLAWVDDFSDDPVRVTSDFYEVMLALQQMRRAA